LRENVSANSARLIPETSREQSRDGLLEGVDSTFFLEGAPRQGSTVRFAVLIIGDSPANVNEP